MKLETAIRQAIENSLATTPDELDNIAQAVLQAVLTSDEVALMPDAPMLADIIGAGKNVVAFNRIMRKAAQENPEGNTHDTAKAIKLALDDVTSEYSCTLSQLQGIIQIVIETIEQQEDASEESFTGYACSALYGASALIRAVRAKL